MTPPYTSYSDGQCDNVVAIVELAGEMGKITDSTTVGIEDVNHDDDDTTDDITVQVPERLAVTVMTTNTDRAIIALSGEAVVDYSDTSSPATYPYTYDHDGDGTTFDPVTPDLAVPSAVASWWDGLSDADRIAALGLVKDGTPGDSDTCDIPFCVTGFRVRQVSRALA